MDAHIQLYKRHKEYLRCKANLDKFFSQPDAKILSEVRRVIRRM